MITKYIAGFDSAQPAMLKTFIYGHRLNYPYFGRDQR